MAEQEIFELVLRQLKSQTSDIEVNSVNITNIGFELETSFTKSVNVISISHKIITDSSILIPISNASL